MTTWLAALSLALCASPQAAQESGVPTLDLARELAALEGEASVEEVGRRIRALGPGAAPAILEALGADLAGAEEASLDLARRQHGALLQAVRGLGRAPFAPLLGEASASADPRQRLAVLEVVGAVGSSADLRVALLAATPALPSQRPDARLSVALEETALALLNRERGTLVALRPSILAAHPELAGRLIQALGSWGEPGLAQLASELLGFDARLDLPLLSQLGRVRHELAPEEAEVCAERVRPYLASPDRQLVRAAAVALGALQDPEALDALVELGSSADHALAAASFQALRRLTGLSLPDRAERWKGWLAVERDWQRTRGPALIEDLRARDAARVCAALRELSLHPLDRRRQVALVVGFLDHEDARVRAQACHSLKALGPELARGSLERASSDRARSVASAAIAALGTP